MAQFNTGSPVTAPRSRRGRSPLATSATPDVRTHEGGLGYSFAAKSELFLLLSGSFITEAQFYEGADARVLRVRELVEQIVREDESADRSESGSWFAGFARWLRTQAFIRSGTAVLAAEAVHARLAVNAFGFNRDIINGALDRGDEPGELIGYWLTRFGKTIPIAVKRGVADAVVRLYSEYSTLRYDTASHPIRFGDVVELVQPRTNASVKAGAQNHALYRHLIDRRHAYNTSPIPEGLTTLRARAELEALPVEARRAVLTDGARLKAAAMSWESLAGWLQGPMDAAAWEVVAPTMGYMALLRNLRNFDEAGVSRAVATAVAARLADPAQVAKSRQLPFRFWTAYRSVSNDRWRVSLGDALELATANIPEGLSGRTLVLVDTSASMGQHLSERGSVSYMEVGALFGTAMAHRFGVGNVDMWGWASTPYPFRLTKGASVLAQVRDFVATEGHGGHGTDLPAAMRGAFNGHDRVVVFSDMQTVGGFGRGAFDRVPANVPVYGFNLAGHSTTAVPTGESRHNLGGFSDKTFGWMALAERGLKAGWPWETAA